MAVNINLPVPSSNDFGIELLTASGLDFKLQDAGVWIGGVRVDARRGGASLFVTAEGNASRSVRASTPSDPFWGGQNPVDWRGAALQWWSVGAGGGAEIGNGAAVVGGFRAEHFSLRLTDPEDRPGVINFFESTYGDRYSADLLTKLYVPYVGLRFEGLNFTGSILFSPYTWANVKIPFRYFYVGIPGVVYGFEDARYTFRRGGVLLEGNLDCRVQASANTNCTVWFKGNWCQNRSNGREDYTAVVTALGVTVFSDSNSGSALGCFTSYVLAGGLAFDYAF